MCDTSWWAMMIHMVSHWIHQELHQEPGQEDPGRSCHKRVCCKSWDVNCCKWWKNCGKMVEKWWENGGKIAGNPMWLKLQLIFFVLKFFRKMENQTAWLCQLCPQQMTNTWTFKKGDLYTRVNSLVQHTHVTNQSCTSKCWTSQATIGIHQLSIQLSVSFWFGSVLVSGHMAVTEEQRIFATDLARLTILYLSFEMPR